MAETDFILLWKEQYAQIEQSLKLNQQILKELISNKARGAILSLKGFNIAGIIITLIYLGILGLVLSIAIAHYTPAANYFIVSISAIFLINVKGLIDYVRHLALASAIDYNASITVIQEKLLQLKFSLFQHNRFMFLQLPFWTTFFLSNKWFPQSAAIGYIILQILITGSFCFLAVWLYKNHTIKNAHKKWVQVFIAGSRWKKIQDALDFYKEIEHFKLSDQSILSGYQEECR